MGRLGDGPDRRFCAVLRDITAFKKAEGELIGAKHAAEEASAQKSDLLAKISHEIRTPLNAILGFAEVMLEERFGPIGNDRYKEYLKDVHASGSHVISLVNDLLDLAKIEAGRLELSFTGVSLNDLVSACVTLLQPQAARDRIVMRMSFAPKLPPVVADERSMRQIVLNLVSNAIKFTDAGGQVIVSTAMTDRGEVAFRVRDTGIGMTPEEVEAALEPFRQLATSRKRGGTGLGLPLTKALVEANRGALQIASQPSEGTLVEVIFPPTRVLAECAASPCAAPPADMAASRAAPPCAQTCLPYLPDLHSRRGSGLLREHVFDIGSGCEARRRSDLPRRSRLARSSLCRSGWHGRGVGTLFGWRRTIRTQSLDVPGERAGAPLL